MLMDKNQKELTALVLSIPLVGFFTWYITIRRISYREILVLLVTVASMVVLVNGKRGVQIGLIFWILTLGIGYRTVEVTRYLKIHPSEIVLWGLLCLVIAQRGILKRHIGEFWLPAWVWFFIPFWIFGWLPGLSAGRPWDKMFSEFKNFLLLVPLFIVVEMAVQDRQRWRHLLLAFFIAGTWIASFGVLEYLFPEIRNIFPRFVSNPIPTLTAESFQRARFSFWGTPVATFVCVLTLPIGLSLWRWWPKVFHRVTIIIAAIVQIFGIYIGGYRSMWALLSLEILVWAVFRFGPLLGGITLLPLGLFYRYLPVSTQERVLSAILAFEGRPIDSSAINRWDRLSVALQTASKNPFGVGWAGSGWPHSDFAQVAANLGVLAGLLFLGAYLFTLFRLWSQLRRELDNKALPLLLSFLACGGQLAMQGVQVLPQLFLPVIFVWVLVEIYLWNSSNQYPSISSLDIEEQNEHSTNLSFTAHL